jgi:hypothetical protein
VRDNFLSGTLECRIQTKAEAANVELGVVRLSGAVSGKKLELSQTAKCIDFGDGGLQFGILGRADVAVEGRMTIPNKSWDSLDSLTLDPFMSLASERVPVIFSLVESRPKGVPEPTIAYGRSGTIVFERFPTTEDPTLGVRLEIELAPTQPIPRCSGKVCETQADCGMVPDAVGGYAFPSCVELTEGGVRHCRHFCRNDADCASAGGDCSFGLCVTPWCEGQEKPAACNGATRLSCEHCCELETGGAGIRHFFEKLYPRCACAVDAPCREECAGVCTTGVEADAGACLDCVRGDQGKTCKAAVDDECRADPACLAYMRCADKCY